MTIETHRPATRADWLALRRQDVTASQIGTLVGAHPYLSPFELWHEKRGGLPADDLDSPAMRRGRYLERIAAELCQEQMPAAEIQFRAPFEYWRDPEARIGATPDLILHDPAQGRGCVQIKSVEPSIFRRTWRPDTADPTHIEPPLWIALQALTEAHLTGAQWAAVAALRIGHAVEFDLIPVPIHRGAWDRLKGTVADFWRMVETGQPPRPDYARDGRLIADLYPADDGATLDLGHDNAFCHAVAERQRLKAEASAIAETVAALDAEIRHKAGAAQTVTAGPYTVTLKTQTVKEYTVAASTRRPIRVSTRPGSPSG